MSEVRVTSGHYHCVRRRLEFNRRGAATEAAMRSADWQTAHDLSGEIVGEVRLIVDNERGIWCAECADYASRSKENNRGE